MVKNDINLLLIPWPLLEQLINLSFIKLEQLLLNDLILQLELLLHHLPSSSPTSRPLLFLLLCSARLTTFDLLHFVYNY